jgi:hypothetical protein
MSSGRHRTLDTLIDTADDYFILHSRLAAQFLYPVVS